MGMFTAVPGCGGGMGGTAGSQHQKVSVARGAAVTLQLQQALGCLRDQPSPAQTEQHSACLLFFAEGSGCAKTRAFCLLLSLQVRRRLRLQRFPIWP